MTSNKIQTSKQLKDQEQVAKFIKNLNHPLKPEIEYVRGIILETNSQLAEHIKWNAPSYYLHGDDRITFNLHGKDGFRLIFHCGSKVTEYAKGEPLFEDSTNLLEWVAGDRAMIKFRSMDDIEAKKERLKQVINKWIEVTKDMKNIQIEVHRATEDESQIILDLWKGSARWIQSKGINQWNPDSLNINQVQECFNNGFEIYLARWNEEVVGTLYICWSDPILWEELDNDESGYIHRFAVSRDHAGNGIGKQFIRWAEDYIRDRGKKFIRLDCMAENARLNQYYLDAGYKHIRFLEWKNGWKINLYEKDIILN